MKMTQIGACFVACLLIAGCRAKTGPEATLELIQKVGGSYKTDDRLMDKPVVTVDLRGMSITDDQLANLKELPQLQILVLDSTKVSDAGLESLKECTELQRVFLRNTRVSPAGVEGLRKALPKAEIYDK